MGASSPDRPGSTWSLRAPAYARLIARTPAFDHAAQQVAALFPPDATGRAADLAAGTGLLAEALLLRAPAATVALIEPAQGMLALARTRLAPHAARTTFHRGAAEDIAPAWGPFEFAGSTAGAHLFDDARTFAALSAVLRPGAPYRYHLWGHSFDETEAADASGPDWRALLRQVCADHGVPAPPPAPPPRRVVRTRGGIAKDARAAGFTLEDISTRLDPIHDSFGIEFAAMDPTWLAQAGEGRRAAILEACRAALTGTHTSASAYVTLRRRA